jgi:hypothetical protein
MRLRKPPNQNPGTLQPQKQTNEIQIQDPTLQKHIRKSLPQGAFKICLKAIPKNRNLK